MLYAVTVVREVTYGLFLEAANEVDVARAIVGLGPANTRTRLPETDWMEHINNDPHALMYDTVIEVEVIPAEIIGGAGKVKIFRRRHMEALEHDNATMVSDVERAEIQAAQERHEPKTSEK